jgi:hypothetical protein
MSSRAPTGRLSRERSLSPRSKGRHPIALMVVEVALEAAEPVRDLGLGFTIGGVTGAVQEAARQHV